MTKHSPIIYIAGPYSNPIRAVRDANVNNADRIAREIVAIGKELGIAVRTFVPHRLYHGWEEDERGIGEHEFVMRICLDWLRKADALYYIAPSPGANRELEEASLAGITVLANLDEVWDWLAEWKEEDKLG